MTFTRLFLLGFMTMFCVYSAGVPIAFAQENAQVPAQVPAPQKLNWLQKLFPSLRPKDRYDPYRTLQAPFMDAPAEGGDINLYTRQTNEQYKNLGELQKNLAHAAKAIPLNLPHENIPAIRNWLVTVLAQSLTFTENSEAELQAALANFTDNGRKQYLTYLKDSGALAALKSKQYRVGTILLDPPLLRTEKEAGGRYKWLFEADVLTTYMDIQSTDYRTTTARNDQVTLNIQITRADVDAENAKDGLLIEIWQVKD